MDKQTFVNQVKPYAEKAGSELGVNPDYIVAHWAHETGYGTNTGFKNNNLAGYMAYKGSPYGVNGKSFDNLGDFTEAYVSMLNNKRYEGVKSASSSTDFAKALKNGGYASDPNYSQSSTWTEAFELSSGTKVVAETEEFQEVIPNILTQPSEFFGWVEEKAKFYLYMIFLLVLLLFLGYVVFVKDTGVGEGLKDIAKVAVTKGAI